MASLRSSGARRRFALVLSLAAIVGGADACVRRPPGLIDPSPELLDAPAPDSFTVQFATSAGDFTLMARRVWAPRGVDRLYYLVTHNYYDQTRFFRVIKGYVAQFGLSGDPQVAASWNERKIDDDPVQASNRRGRVSFASAGPKTRTTQLFINLVDNPRLDTLGRVGFAPIAEVTDGMDVVDRLYAGYGEGPPRGTGPDQDRIEALGTPYLQREYPKLDYVLSTSVLREWR